MVAEATFLREAHDNRLTAAAAIAAGEVYQLGDGRAAVKVGLNAAAANDKVEFRSDGIHEVAKTAGIVLLDGGRAYWDFSANAVYFKKINDRDFYVGRIVGDASSASTTCKVNFNVDTPYDVDLIRDAALTVPTGTQAVGAFGYPKKFGGSLSLQLTATNEAQCIDLFSVDRFAVAAKGVAEFIIRAPDAGSGAAVDINIGVANGTHTSDFDSVTEYCALHIDGGSTAINAQSKDGTTTVAATDTTKVVSAGSAVANRFECWIDYRDNANVKIYIDGVRVLSGTTFALGGATGPLGLIVHMEKTSGTTTGQVIVDAARCRLMQQSGA